MMFCQWFPYGQGRVVNAYTEIFNAKLKVKIFSSKCQLFTCQIKSSNMDTFWLISKAIEYSISIELLLLQRYILWSWILFLFSLHIAKKFSIKSQVTQENRKLASNSLIFLKNYHIIYPTFPLFFIPTSILFTTSL